MASNDDPGGSGRRTFLQRAALAGGAAALAACGAGGGAAGSAATAAPGDPFAAGRRVLRVSGRILAPAPGDGELDLAAVGFGGPVLDPGSGAAIGTFRASAAPELGAGLELQTLKLAEGTLLAVGERSGGRSGTYVVVGGTDAFAGARGTCEVRALQDGPVRAELELTLSLG